MSISPSSGCVILNLGYKDCTRAAGVNNPQSIRIHLTNQHTSHKVYLSGANSDKVRQLYLIKRDQMKVCPSLEMTLDDLRGITIRANKQDQPLEIECPPSLRQGQTYCLIVTSGSQKASIQEGLIQTTDAQKYQLQPMRKTLVEAVHSFLLALMEEMEWDFLLKHNSVGISDNDESSFAKAAIEQSIAEFSPQELDGFLRQILSYHSRKQSGDARSQQKANDRQIKMCLHFLGEKRLKNIMRTHLLAHAGAKPIPYVEQLIENLADQFFLKLCIHYSLYAEHHATDLYDH